MEEVDARGWDSSGDKWVCEHCIDEPFLPLLDAIPPVRGRVCRPRRKPDSLFADRGYDHGIYRDQVRGRGVIPAIARRGT